MMIINSISTIIHTSISSSSIISPIIIIITIIIIIITIVLRAFRAAALGEPLGAAFPMASPLGPVGAPRTPMEGLAASCGKVLRAVGNGQPLMHHAEGQFFSTLT